MCLGVQEVAAAGSTANDTALCDVLADFFVLIFWSDVLCCCVLVPGLLGFHLLLPINSLVFAVCLPSSLVILPVLAVCGPPVL